LAIILVAAGLLGGCAGPQPELTAPQVTTSPYEAREEVLWAVVPLRNESGTSGVDPLVVSDKVVAAAEQIRGVRCLPLNRTIATMRSLKMDGLSSAVDLATLARAMNVDAVLAGSITAYDPYEPAIGLSMVLYAKPGSAIEGGTITSAINPKALSGATQERPSAGNRPRDGVVASVSEHLDGKNHQVLMDVRAYAEGRSKPTDALNWRRFVASMPLYEEFATSFAVSRLMQSEWLRLGRAVVQEAREPGGLANVQGGRDVIPQAGDVPEER
jgi:hypothetical protein